MKTTKRLLSCLLVLAMMFALAIPAFAAGKTIEVKNSKTDAKYTLYKLFDAQVTTSVGDPSQTVYSYVLPESKTLDKGDKVPFEEIAGHVVPKTGVDNSTIENYTEWFMAQTQTNGLATIVGVKDRPGANNLKWENLTDGYYFLVKKVMVDGEEKTIIVNITTVGQDTVTIFDKNSSTDKPGENPGNNGYKWVSNADGDPVDVDTVELGEVKDFTIEFATVNYVTVEVDETVTDDATDTETTKKVSKVVPITQYDITDVPTGMTVDFNADSTKVYVGTQQLTKGEDYTVSNNGKTIRIDWTKERAVEGTLLYSDPNKITITYKGTITALGTEDDPIENDATITYKANGNDIEIHKPGSNPEVKLYTGSITVLKVDGKDDEPLGGAVFVLKDKNDETGKYLTAVMDATNTKVVDYKWESTIGDDTVKMTSDATTGKATFTGLKAGTYYLVEYQAPEGYNGTDKAEPAEIKLEKDEVNSTTEKEVWQVTSKEVKIANNRGAVLPSTGGIGTTMFYVIGGILVAAAVVVLVSKKRMGAEQ